MLREETSQDGDTNRNFDSQPVTTNAGIANNDNGRKTYMNLVDESTN